MNNKQYIQIIKNIIIAWGYVPYLFIFSLLSFYFHTAFILDKFPRPSINDPKNFEIYDAYFSIISLSLNLMFYPFGLWMFLSIYLDRKFNFQINRMHFILIFSGYFFSIILFFSDIMEWFVD